MERGLYAAASAMVAQQTIQESLAQNIANAATPAYKQDMPTFKALHSMMMQRTRNATGNGPEIGELGTGVAPDRVYTDWQAGSLSQTGNPLDLSLGVNQFFAIQTPAGERYTRAGNFMLDAAGKLVDSAGQAVLGTDGRPIMTGGRTGIVVDTVGNVVSNKTPFARIRIVQGDPATMLKVGNNLFSAAPGTFPPAVRAPQVLPGTLEQSNVNTVISLVEMISVTRGFDMAQRAIIAQDEMLRHAANDLGKL